MGLAKAQNTGNIRKSYVDKELRRLGSRRFAEVRIARPLPDAARNLRNILPREHQHGPDAPADTEFRRPPPDGAIRAADHFGRVHC